jgi:uncharacterized protein HemX
MKATIVVVGLAAALPVFAQQQPESKTPAEKAQEQRERAIARCKENRGADCESEAGLAEWLLQERTRDEAEADSSRSVHQTAPRPTPHPGN